MIKPLWAIAGVALLGTATVAGAIVVASSGGEEEVVSQVETATPAASVTPSTAASATPTPGVALPTAVLTSPPLPTDWLPYSDPGGLFTIRYPPTWFEIAGEFYSWDPRKSSDYSVPSEVVNVEVGYYEAAGSSGCGALTVDSSTGAGTPIEGAIETSLGGFPAWEIVRVQGDPAVEGNVTRIQGKSLIYKGYCFLLTAYFTQQNPDVVTFVQIASSFQFQF